MRSILKFLPALVLATFFPAGLQAQALPPLEFPADCRIGEDCWILSFVDLDARPGYIDHRCGVRTYEAHKGTDIALVDARTPDASVPVRAAAGGIVVGVRDGVPDNELGGDIADHKGQECGNGVRISHGGDWFTQYCHMKRGSIAVKPQQRVEAGAVLGMIGSSGRSETPHLHFQLSRGKDIVDPFTGRAQSDAPSCAPGSSLWSAAAQEKFGPYQPAYIRHAGFSVTIPTLRGVQKTPQPPDLPGNRPSLVLYAVVYGVPEGSTIRFNITTPDGSTLINTSQTVPRNKARQFQYAGRKTPEGGWPPGEYVGEVTVSLPPAYGTEPAVARTTVVLR